MSLHHVLLGPDRRMKKKSLFTFFRSGISPRLILWAFITIRLCLGLPEYFRQTHGRQCAAAQHIAEGAPRSHGRQLVRVSHQNQALSLGDGPQKAVQQPDIHHGHLVHNHRVGLQRVCLIPGKVHLSRVLDRCPPPEGGEWWRPPPPSPRVMPLGGSARRGRHQTAQLHPAKELQNAL